MHHALELDSGCAKKVRHRSAAPAGIQHNLRAFIAPLSVRAAAKRNSFVLSNASTPATKIVFDDPDIQKQSEGFLSVDDLIRTAERALEVANYDVWLRQIIEIDQ